MDLSKDPRDRILVAMDTSDVGELNRLSRAVGQHVGGFKIGLEAMHAIGLRAAVNAMRGHGRGYCNVFADAKLCDIPNTVGQAAKSIVSLPEIAYLNVHASSGVASMKAVVKEKRHAKVLAVTVLTSLNRDEMWRLYGYDQSPVTTMAKMAVEAGVDGIICSPQDLEDIEHVHGIEKLLKVTPGVRPKWASANDQKRVMTPGEAIRAGSTHLVIGRPILKPPSDVGSPVAAALRIAEEIAEALR